MPNAWLYKLLGDLITPTKSHSKRNSPPPPPPPSPEHQHQQQLKPKRYSAPPVVASVPRPHLPASRKSYHYTRKSVSTIGTPSSEYPINFEATLPNPPRKSAKKRSSTKSSSFSSSSITITTSTDTPPQSSSSTSSADYASLDLLRPGLNRFPKSRVPRPESRRYRTDQDLLPADHDIIMTFDVAKKKKKMMMMMNQREISSSFALDSVPSMELAPIIARPEKFSGSSVDRVVMRRRRLSPTGVRLRVKSPRRITKKGAVAGSFAVVKSSSDPRRDFRESMVEMILANEMKRSKELEELLACYLSLNSDEYHYLIVEAFEQIWLDLKKIKK